MKTTPFYAFHKALHARMHEFAGYDMPIEYRPITEEHLHVIHHVGVFDVSHMGEIRVCGDGACAFLQQMTSNDVSRLIPGKIQYSCIMNQSGGVVDDFLLYQLAEKDYLLVVNASNVEKDYEWLRRFQPEDVLVVDHSAHYAQLAVQGPEARTLLQRFTTLDLSSIPYYQFEIGKWAGCGDVIFSNTGYTGAGGFELYFDVRFADKIWEPLFTPQADVTVLPIGLGARDTLRLEMGFCLYGHELSEHTTPLEAGLGWITKFVDGKPFLGRAILEEQKKQGLTRRLVAFKMIDKGIARHGYEIVDDEGQVIGHVTSGSISPCLKVGVGMGFVDVDYDALGSIIYIRIRNKNLRAEVERPPFR